GMIAPAALTVLAADDELNGTFEGAVQLGADLVVVNHAVEFGEEECAEAVAVHGPVRGGSGIVEEAAPAAEVSLAFLLTHDVFERAGHVLAVLAAARHVTARHEGESGEAGDRDIAPILIRAEGPIAMLGPSQIGEPLIDGQLGLVRDHPLGSA